MTAFLPLCQHILIMKNEIISQLHSSFELAVNETDGVEYWFARDLQELLGYNEW